MKNEELISKWQSRFRRAAAAFAVTILAISADAQIVIGPNPALEKADGVNWFSGSGGAAYVSLTDTKFLGGLPTNAASVLKLSSPSNSVSGVTVTWQSVSGVTYYLQGSTNLAAQPAFTSIQSNLVGQAGSTSYTDTTATNNVPYFYRVGVQ